MDFVLDLQIRASIAERHPIGTGQRVVGIGGSREIRDVIHSHGSGLQATHKVFRLHEPQTSVYVPRFWSLIYGPSTFFSEHFNLYYTSENCARKALLASWRQEFLYDHGREHITPLDDEIELMTVAYRDRSDPPYLVERNGNSLVRIPVTAYYLGGHFYLVQKLAAA